MTNFDVLFEQTTNSPVEYAGKQLYRSHKFPVKNGDSLKICIEKTNSPYVQGVCLTVIGKFKIREKILKKSKKTGIRLWENDVGVDIKNMIVTVLTKEDFLWIDNICEIPYSYLIGDEKGNPIEIKKTRVDGMHNGAAMLIEEIENGNRYYCNDIRPIGTFDSIVFTVQKIN